MPINNRQCLLTVYCNLKPEGVCEGGWGGESMLFECKQGKIGDVSG